MAETKHRHWFSSLWSTYGPYGPQDKHFHPCVAEDKHCLVMVVGDGRDCKGTKGPHEIDESEPVLPWDRADG